MTATIRTDDPNVPFFNELLLELPGGEIVMQGGLKVPQLTMPDFLAEAFEIDPNDFVLLNGTHVPTVSEIEADILAGLVPLHQRHEDLIQDDELEPPSEPNDEVEQPTGRHREHTDEDDEEPEEQADAAVDPGNRDS